MMDTVIIKFHELALKGKNRPMFIRRLSRNLKQAVRGTGVKQVWLGHMLVGMTMAEGADWPEISQRIRDCFGVAKFFPAHKVGLDLNEVKALLPSELRQRRFESFRITAHRSDKRFPMRSYDINRDLGAFVQEQTGAAVKLKNPDLEIFLDVQHDGILVYFDEVRGYGGMPVGVSGTTMALLSGGIDSPVAAWYMMKRGSISKFVHFHSHPLVDTSSIEKATELTQMLTRYQYNSELYLVPFAKIQQQIIVSVPPSYRVVLYRRFMVRIAETLARKHEAAALVTGESLAQVASQTLDNITVIDEVAQMPILRPLIGFNKNEIIDVSQEIGTYPVSILPDQDCCSLFVPKHPVIHGNIKTVNKLEAVLPIDDMVAAALEQVELKRFSFPEG
ncbi:MAG: tRNA 4-thiouridine(8) synthase ThiI [Chloroflexi bacterium]|nr:tRNA 4-thiouridine(8) synthase ThiI [Chloroflexota bacterium]